MLANNILVMDMPNLNKNQKLFIGSVINNLNYGGYNNYPRVETLKNDVIKLPVKNGKINYKFMDEYINHIENECIEKISLYLKASKIDNYHLTEEEQIEINSYDSLEWNSYNLKDLFGESTRGKRLKSEDRISGNLPFVTAGEAKEGVSDFIGNKVHVFSKNTVTIDMFGSAKYRNYEYGGDDHIAVVHTEKLPINAAIFVTAAIHKSAHNGQFDYGRNFYAKDADNLNILLPTKEGKPDFNTMIKIISAVHKIVIKDVIIHINNKITEKVNNN